MTFPIEAGDVVVCIDNLPDENTPPRLYVHLADIAVGKMYRVARVVANRRGVGLILEGLSCPRKSGWAARRFKKLRKADQGFLAKAREIA